MSKALVLGATGETGRHVLLSALANPAFSQVFALGRKAPTVDPSVPGYAKLVSEPLLSFDGLLTGDPAEVNKIRGIEADSVLVALGTTRAAAGSFDAFVKIDRSVLAGASGGERD